MMPLEEFAEQLRRQQAEHEQGNPAPPTLSRELPSIHYTELGDPIPGSPIAVEWKQMDFS